MQSLISAIRQAKRIAVISHIHPDGDAVGSTLALTLGLIQMGIDATPYLKDGVPTIFRYLEKWQLFSTDTLPDEIDLCLVLDLSEAARTGFPDKIRAYSKRGALAQIDHHPAGDIHRLTTTRAVAPEMSSTCEIVVSVLKELGVRITPAIAMPLLTGMYTDTGGFQYSNTSQATMEASAELMRRGGNLQKIVQHISHEKSIAHLKLVGIALERLAVSWDGRCATSVITHADVTALGAKDEDLTGVVNELNTLSGVQFITLLTEIVPGTIRGSFRTADGSFFNVAALARSLGGNGHPRAAGFIVENSTLEETPSGWRVAPFLVS